MKRLFYLMMFGFAFTAFQVVSVGADDAALAEVDISHCADLPPTTRPACEAQAHGGPPGGPGGPGHHPPAGPGGPGGPGHHPPESMPPAGMPPMGNTSGMPPAGEAMCFDAATQTSIPCSDMPGADASMTPPPSSHPGGPGHHPPAGPGGPPGGPGHHPPGGPGQHDGPDDCMNHPAGPARDTCLANQN